MTHITRTALFSLLVVAFPVAGRANPTDDEDIARRFTAAQIPTENLAQPLRGKVEEILHKPTIFARGPVEAFPCLPTVYHWLLDNPHCGFHAWKALGVKCATVEKKEDGSFQGVDPQGGELRWQVIHSERGRHVWYGEGSGKLTPISSPIVLKALIVLHHQEVQGSDGRIGIRHRAELFANYDAKKAGSLAMRLWGLTNEATGKKVTEQLELFFSGLAWYVSENPNWARTTLRSTPKLSSVEKGSLETLLRSLPNTVDTHKLPPTVQSLVMP